MKNLNCGAEPAAMMEFRQRHLFEDRKDFTNAQQNLRPQYLQLSSESCRLPPKNTYSDGLRMIRNCAASVTAWAANRTRWLEPKKR
jgi:hypothetical protein